MIQFKKGTSEVISRPALPSDAVDYRKRCVVTMIHGDRGFNRVIYGVTAAEYNAAVGFDSARDMTTDYKKKR